MSKVWKDKKTCQVQNLVVFCFVRDVNYFEGVAVLHKGCSFMSSTLTVAKWIFIQAACPTSYTASNSIRWAVPRRKFCSFGNFWNFVHLVKFCALVLQAAVVHATSLCRLGACLNSVHWLPQMAVTRSPRKQNVFAFFWVWFLPVLDSLNDYFPETWSAADLSQIFEHIQNTNDWTPTHQNEIWPNLVIFVALAVGSCGVALPPQGAVHRIRTTRIALFTRRWFETSTCKTAAVSLQSCFLAMKPHCVFRIPVAGDAVSNELAEPQAEPAGDIRVVNELVGWRKQHQEIFVKSQVESTRA